MASKKMNKKQRNQIIILAVLSVVLVLVMYWQYLISPILSECDEITVQIEADEMEQLSVMMEIASINDYTAKIEDSNAHIARMTADLFEPMTTEEADILLLRHITESGLTPQSLALTAGPATEGSSTGVSRITATYAATGSYAQLLRLIERINGEPAIVLSQLSSAADSTTTETLTITMNGPEASGNTIPASENDMTFTLVFELYMYESPEIPDYFIDEEEDLMFEEGSNNLLDSADDYL